LAQACQDTDTGLHIHLAEGTTDRALTSQDFNRPMIEPFARRGMLGPKSVFAHCIDLRPDEIDQLIDSATPLAHNPSSNMNNRVGISPLWARSSETMLGTDGIGADMYRESKTAWFRGMEAAPSCSPGAVLGMLQNSTTTLGRHLGLQLGRIAPGQSADIQILRYRPPTSLHAGNLGGHFLFGMSAAHVETTIVGGVVRWHRGEVPGVDLQREYAVARQQAENLWARMLAM
jgi:cytosine/adenosine deaminase-related metal-dependent hydrolase